MLITQVLAEMYACEPTIVNADALVAAARAAAEAVGATIVDEITVSYAPHGLTIAVFLAESHIVLTTWPEFRLLLLDVLLCNEAMDPREVVDKVAASLCPTGEVVTHDVPRRVAQAP